MKEKTVFFDLDDTLYDRSGPYLAAFRQFFGGRYEDKAAQAYQAVMHRGYEVFTAAHTGKISMDAMHIYRHQIGLLDVGIRITAAQALQLQAVYAAQQQRITLSAAVRAALESTGKVILQDHIRHCIVDAVEEGDEQAITDLCAAIDKFFK